MFSANVGNDFDDLTVVYARRPYRLQVLVRHQAAIRDELLAEMQDGVGLGVGRSAPAAVEDLLAGQADHLTDGAVCSNTIIARVGLAHDQRNLFACLGRKARRLLPHR